MSVKVKYKGNEILSINTDTSKKLKTSGKYCEGDIEITNKQDGGITPSGNKAITATTATQTGIDVANFATVSVAPTPSETKTATANGDVTPSSGKLLSKVTVNVAGGLNPHSTTWDFSSRTERRINAGLNGSYAFKSDSTSEWNLYLPTDDTIWINGGNVTTAPKVNSSYNTITLWCSVSNVTSTGFTLKNGTGVEGFILLPYFLKSGQTIRITYTHSSSNFGGHIWCDVHGKFVSKVNNNQSGATTSTYSFTAPTDGWFYWEVGKYDANAYVTISNATVVIS